MKKLLKKRVLIPLAIVVALAIAAGAAYAAFSSTASTAAANVTTATNGLTLAESGWVGGLTNLLPAVDTNSFNSTYARSEIININNTSGYDFSSTVLTDALSANPGDIGSLLHVAIFDPSTDGAPFATWTVDQLQAGSQNLGVLTTGTTATIKLVVWLDSSAGPNYAGIIGPQLTFTLTGNQ